MTTKVKVKEYKRKTIVKAHTRHKPTTKQKEPNQKMSKFDEPKADKNEPKKEKKWVKIGETTGGLGNRDVYELQD